MSSVVIGAKNNLVKTDKNNTLTGVNTFEGNTIFTGDVEGLVITDIENLQTELEDKASLTQLQSETDQRINADILLNDAILLKASQTDLSTEITNRENADDNLIDTINDLNTELGNAINTETQSRVAGDTGLQNDIDAEITNRENVDTDLQNQINLKLAEANSIFRANYTKYVVDGRDNIQVVIDSITNEGTIVFLSSGSIGGSGLTINKQNIALIAPKSTPPILEILQETTTAITGDRIRMTNIQIDGVFNAGSSRSVYTDCVFTENVNILASQTSGYMTFNGCSFTSGKVINVANNFANVIYFINCNFGGAIFSLNQFSNQQVIFSNCGGFVSFPTNAFYAGINTLTSGYIQNTITKTILTAGAGNVGQILTSGGLNGADTWTTPSGGGGGSSGAVLERFTRYTLGQTITTTEGNITLPNVVASQTLPTTSFNYADMTGSSITYQPPSGTTTVEYELNFYAYSQGQSSGAFGMLFQIDGVEQTICRQILTTSNGTSSPYGQQRYSYKVVIEIGGSTDPSKCRVSSWNSPKTLKVRVGKINTSGAYVLHIAKGTPSGFILIPPDGTGAPQPDVITPPIITITAC